jgi:hypothetical protein
MSENISSLETPASQSDDSKQTVTGHSNTVSFDEALKDAISQLKLPDNKSGGHSNRAAMRIEISAINADVGGFTQQPSKLSVTITAGQTTHC